MKKSYSCITLSLLIALFVHARFASSATDTATQNVSIEYKAFAVIGFEDAPAKNQTLLTVDSTGVIAQNKRLVWTTNKRNMKITIHSDLTPGKQNYTLKAKAGDINSNGIHHGWVTVTNRPVTLISDINCEIGACTPQYQAVPKNPGTDAADFHIVTFTITD